jgi:hypothetical protein
MAVKNTLSCREATRLLLEDEDHELGSAERMALQVHVKICFACQRFVSQLNFMRRATRAWRKHSESDVDDTPT